MSEVRLNLVRKITYRLKKTLCLKWYKKFKTHTCVMNSKKEGNVTNTKTWNLILLKYPIGI